METGSLFYKKFNNIVESKDYVAWSISMIENNHQSISLYSLSTFKEPYNIFEIEEYFERALKELKVSIPSFEESCYEQIRFLSRIILKDENKAIDIAQDIYHISVELGYPDDLEEWFYISEMRDSFYYGGNRNSYKVKKRLVATIVEAAKQQLKK